MPTCHTCDRKLPEEDFPKYRIVGDTIYRRKTCRNCTKPKNRGFEGRITAEDEKKLIEHKDDFDVISGSDFYAKVKPNLTLQQFYRYVRDGSVRRWYLARSATAKPKPIQNP